MLMVTLMTLYTVRQGLRHTDDVSSVSHTSLVSSAIFSHLRVNICGNIYSRWIKAA